MTVHLVRLTGGEAILNCCQVGPRSDRLSELGAIVDPRTEEIRSLLPRRPDPAMIAFQLKRETCGWNGNDRPS